jgi:peptide/nickel transport system substrate-binding protein
MASQSDAILRAAFEAPRLSLSRRRVLKLLGAGTMLPLGLSLLAACADDDDDEPAAEASDDSTDEPETDDQPESEDDEEPVDPDDDDEAGEESAADGDPASGGVLELALLMEPDALDPAQTIQAVASTVNANIYDRLIYISYDGAPEPWVAEGWETSDDGRELTFHIRSGITFHDGDELTADAVKFTFDRILDPDMASPALGQAGTLESVEVIDDSTVTLHFTEPYAPIYSNISISYFGIVSPAAVEEHGDQFRRNPVGSGPFQFKEWPTGQHIELERFDDYVNHRAEDDNAGEAYLDGLRFQFIGEAATRLAALETGELHVSDVDLNQAASIAADPDYQVIVWEDATNNNFLEFVDRAPFNEPAVRQAIACCIDRETIVESVYNGYATANLLPMPVGVAGWDEQIGLDHGYPFDTDRAQQILEDDGWERGDDGIWEKGEHRLEFTLLYYSGRETVRISCELMQPTLESVGMAVDLQMVEFGTMQGMIEAGDFDVNWMRWTWPEPVILSLLFKSPGWVGQLSDPDLDELLEAADTEMDPETRIERIHDALRYLLDQAYVAPIVTDWIIVAARSEVHGYRWDSMGSPRYVDVWLEA